MTGDRLELPRAGRTLNARGTLRWALLSGLLSLAPGSHLRAQSVEPRTPVKRLTLGGRVHLQYNTSSAEGVPASQFVLRRARLFTDVQVNDWIEGAAQVDFSGGRASARYAFVSLTLDPALRLSFGQFKRAFDLFELTSSSQILVVERDGQIPGEGSCPGVGGVCSYSRFSEQLELSSLDIGVLAEGDLPGGHVSYRASVTNGPGGNTAEENSAKSVSARLSWHATPSMTWSVNAAVHDHPDSSGATGYAPAAALDVEVGDFDAGPHLQAGIMTGENWRNLDAAGESSTFLAVQGIATYRFPLREGRRIVGVEPLARLSWGDPDTSTGGDGGLLVTPGVVLHFEGRNKLAADLDAWRPRTGATAWSLKVQTYLYF